MRIDIYEPQAIWEIGQQSDQQDIIYPRKGETDEADRLFILCDGRNAHGTTSKNIVDKISSYFKRYQTARGQLSDDTLREAISTGLPTDGNGNPIAAQASLAMICLHNGGATLVNTGRSKIFHIRPSQQRLLFESRERNDGEISDPSIVHVTNIQSGDYFVIFSDGMLENMNEDDVCAFFSEAGSDDKKRNLLRSSTSANKDNHSALFFKIRGTVAESGDDFLEDNEQSSADNALSGRPAPARKPKPIVQPQKTNTGNNANEPKIKTAAPISEDKSDDTSNLADKTAAIDKPSYKQLEPKSNNYRQRNVPGTYDEERHSNVRMIILVVAIVILAIAAGALWYFNTPSPDTMPVDSTDVENTIMTDTTATQTTEPADSAMIPDSAIAEPEPTTVPTTQRKHKQTAPDYETDYYYDDEAEPVEEHESYETEPAEPSPSKPATETPKEESSTGGMIE